MKASQLGQDGIRALQHFLHGVPHGIVEFISLNISRAAIPFCGRRSPATTACNHLAQYLAFYACNTKLLPRHKKKLKGLNIGKSCIRFKRLEQLPMEVIRDVVKENVRALKGK